MRMVLLGPPGAGKGTTARRMAQVMGIPHISTGEMFRTHIKNGTDLGHRVKAALEVGSLAPDDLTIELVEERLSHPDTASGFIHDGFPRTVVQADALATLADLDAVIGLTLSDAEIVKRLSGRRVHPGSGRTYHLVYSPPKVLELDDQTGEPLVQRADDAESAVLNRLQIYHRQTAPLLNYYAERALLQRIDSSPPPEQVFAALRRLLIANFAAHSALTRK